MTFAADSKLIDSLEYAVCADFWISVQSFQLGDLTWCEGLVTEFDTFVVYNEWQDLIVTSPFVESRVHSLELLTDWFTGYVEDGGRFEVGVDLVPVMLAWIFLLVDSVAV